MCCSEIGKYVVLYTWDDILYEPLFCGKPTGMILEVDDMVATFNHLKSNSVTIAEEPHLMQSLFVKAFDLLEAWVSCPERRR